VALRYFCSFYLEECEHSCQRILKPRAAPREADATEDDEGEPRAPAHESLASVVDLPLPPHPPSGPGPGSGPPGLGPVPAVRGGIGHVTAVMCALCLAIIAASMMRNRP